jgi:Tfp pilus assembly protein PilN
MQNINLLDPRLVPAAPSVSQPVALLGAAALVCAAIGVGVHGHVEQRLLAQALAAQDHAQAQAQIVLANASATGPGGATTAANSGGASGATGAAANPSAVQDSLRQTVAQREALLAALQRESPGPSHPAQTLNSVVQALPANVWLNELELQGEQRLRITGGTLDPQALAQYAHQLSRAPSLRGTALKTVRLEAVTDLGAGAQAPNALERSRAPSQHQFELASASHSEPAR